MGKTRAFDWDRLGGITKGWLSDGLAKIRTHRPKTFHSDELFSRVAEYCIMRAQEYHAAAFDSLRSQRYYAAMADFRTILEYTIHIWWCLIPPDGFRKRFDRWEKDTARRRRNLYAEWRDLVHSNTSNWSTRNKPVEFYEAYLAKRQSIPALPKTLQCMAKEVKEWLSGFQCPVDFYPTYRMLSEGTHPLMDLDLLFRPVGGALVTGPPPMPWMMPMLATTTPLALVTPVWNWFKWDQDELTRSWEDAKRLLSAWYT